MVSPCDITDPEEAFEKNPCWTLRDAVGQNAPIPIPSQPFCADPTSAVQMKLAKRKNQIRSVVPGDT